MFNKQMTAEQQHLQTLTNRCMVFTDRRGKVLGKSGNPVHASLHMKYDGGQGIIIEFTADSYVMGNGWCRVRVEENGVVVLDASGNFTVAAFNVTAKTYVSGDWENKIPEKFDR